MGLAEKEVLTRTDYDTIAAENLFSDEELEIFMGSSTATRMLMLE
jgi:hypothetical protein